MEHRKTKRTYGENTRIEVRTFQRILKDTNKLKVSVPYRLEFVILCLLSC